MSFYSCFLRNDKENELFFKKNIRKKLIKIYLWWMGMNPDGSNYFVELFITSYSVYIIFLLQYSSWNYEYEKQIWLEYWMVKKGMCRIAEISLSKFAIARRCRWRVAVCCSDAILQHGVCWVYVVLQLNLSGFQELLIKSCPENNVCFAAYYFKIEMEIFKGIIPRSFSPLSTLDIIYSLVIISS